VSACSSFWKKFKSFINSHENVVLNGSLKGGQMGNPVMDFTIVTGLLSGFLSMLAVTQSWGILGWIPPLAVSLFFLWSNRNQEGLIMLIAVHITVAVLLGFGFSLALLMSFTGSSNLRSN
jgi:hypothetical protein